MKHFAAFLLLGIVAVMIPASFGIQCQECKPCGDGDPKYKECNDQDYCWARRYESSRIQRGCGGAFATLGCIGIKEEDGIAADKYQDCKCEGEKCDPIAQYFKEFGTVTTEKDKKTSGGKGDGNGLVGGGGILIVTTTVSALVRALF